MNASTETLQSEGSRPMPNHVPFAFTPAQVDEVTEALREFDWPTFDVEYRGAALAALWALQRVMPLRRTADPRGAPRGYGWRTVWAETERRVIAPDGEPADGEPVKCPQCKGFGGACGEGTWHDGAVVTYWVPCDLCEEVGTVPYTLARQVAAPFALTDTRGTNAAPITPGTPSNEGAETKVLTKEPTDA